MHSVHKKPSAIAFPTLFQEDLEKEKSLQYYIIGFQVPWWLTTDFQTNSPNSYTLYNENYLNLTKPKPKTEQKDDKCENWDNECSKVRDRDWNH